MPSDRLRWVTLSGLIAMGLFGGCNGGSIGEDRLPLVAAEGRVTVKGVPATGAQIMLHPSDPELIALGLFPHGTVDESGVFALSTYEQTDGAPAGRYRVTLTWPDLDYQPKSPLEREELALGVSPPDRLKGRYADPEQSGLELTIDGDGSSSQSLLPLELP
ncbi:carboxypeptidase regulatory-like domain-containing protein [Tautonia rosea]|uniref:carboxypeptidase regulatory-like domain-containing protein n=1 Tax=Tautonia rosea TaxID=2728037 RepID=UPI0014753AC6|nr:carboxypeptidase regulatory-like domain-containing protein [Tautonia rosea]